MVSRSAFGLPTPTIGREDELALLEELLSSSDRIITLTGGPGFGKTRLALEASYAAMQGGRPAAFCDLVGARRLPEVFDALAEVLDVTIGHNPVEELKAHLARSD
ncbi:MAG: hypothetical protein AAGE52_40585 [Myxococcota bacterium]